MFEHVFVLLDSGEERRSNVVSFASPRHCGIIESDWVEVQHDL